MFESMPDESGTDDPDPDALAPDVLAPDALAPDALSTEELIHGIRSLAAGIDVAGARLSRLLGELDAREGWAGAGVTSCAHWLSWQCGVSPHAAREQVRCARALRALPILRAEFEAGRLSYSKVRALTRIAEPDTEADLLELANSATAAQLERTVRGWRRCEVLEGDQAELRRELSWHWDETGMLVLRARLTAEEGATLLAALDAVQPALDAEVRTANGESTDAATENAATENAAADSDDRGYEGTDKAGMTECGTADVSSDLDSDVDDSDGDDSDADDSPVEGGAAGNATAASPRGRRPLVLARTEPVNADGAPFPAPPLAPSPAARLDALLALAQAFLDPGRDIAKNPDTQLVVTVDSAVLAADAAGGLACYRTGGALSAAAARRLACDTALMVILREGRQLLDASASVRTVSKKMKRALLARDGGCRFPGCAEVRMSRLHAHHVWHWADGGPTVLDNLLLLCRTHHHAIHDRGFQVTADDGDFRFADQQGIPLPAVPEPNRIADPIPPADPESIPRWRGDPLQLHWVLAVLRQRRDQRRQAQHDLATQLAARRMQAA